MIDISTRKENPDKAIAYLDGADARVYMTLVSRLGSEEAAQNAVILFGLLSKTRSIEKKHEIQRLFPRLVGVSYKKIDSILEEISF